jgi:NAD+ kinase
MFLYGRAHVDISKELLAWSLAAPDEFGYTWALNDELADAISKRFGVDFPAENRYAEITPEDVADHAFMVSVGGDGTFLEAVHKLHGLPMPVVGLNLGRMGFLANIALQNVKQALADIFAGRFNIQNRSMLAAEGDFGREVEFPCALNEFTIHRHTADMIEVACYNAGELIAVIRGDGAIMSTPTGSTAYSMSAGGPIVDPVCDCFVLSGIAPHNFSIRPLVGPDTSVVTFEIRTRGHRALVSLDNRSFMVGDGARFTIKKSEYSAFLMQIQNISFYDTLRDRTMWGMDKRDNF